MVSITEVAELFLNKQYTYIADLYPQQTPTFFYIIAHVVDLGGTNYFF